VAPARGIARRFTASPKASPVRRGMAEINISAAANPVRAPKNAAASPVLAASALKALFAARTPARMALFAAEVLL